jgi:uncharacterized membrane protein
MQKTYREYYTTERLGAVSDGVFAIVITLLVLDLKVPELPDIHTERQMIDDLEGQIPNFIAWIISFLMIARLWIVHHDIIASLARCHLGTILWNFAVLGIVSLIPFGSALIGTYEFDPLAIAIFSIILGLSGLVLGCFARHGEAETALHREGKRNNLMRHWRYLAWGIPLVACAACVFLFINVHISLAIWLSEPLLASLIKYRATRSA